MDENNQLPPEENQGSKESPPKDEQRLSGEVVHLDRDKIDQVLDSFLKEQETLRERERQRELKIHRKKRAKQWLKFLSFLGIALFVLVIVVTNPETRKQYRNYLDDQAPKEEYSIAYNYSPNMEILPMGTSIAVYDSGNIRLLKKDGSEIFDIPFVLGSWDMETSDSMIYLLDKIEKFLYFIDEGGNFVNKVELSNIPFKIYAGKAGNVIVHYRSEAGVEGVVMFDKGGKLLDDQSYPKTTITMIDISDSNEMTVHGMYRIEPKIANYMYRYSARGKLIFSKNFEDVIFVRQYENESTIALIDINRIDFYDKSSNEVSASLDSLVPAKLIAFDRSAQQIYFLDKRNKLRVINMQGEVVEEKYFQSEYEKMTIHHGKLLMFGQDFVRTPSKELKFPKKIEDFFELQDYLVLVMKGEIKMANKLE
ncbi:MAG: DUF5711 family protein [Peptostreptococcaceae bacterium]|nr:DUF5711 family protein [Peptostreptococcaceae bacterium]